MPIITKSALNGLLYIRNGDITSRWNFPNAVGSNESNPDGIGDGVSLTYSFLARNPAGSGETGFVKFDAALIAATEAVLDRISEIANVQFTRVSAQAGQITFGQSLQGDSSAYAYPPYYGYPVDGSDNITSVSAQGLAGNVWVNRDMHWGVADLQPGQFGYSVLLHEMGHALGLKHPFEGDGSGGGYVLANAVNNERYTVMAYDSAPRSLLVDTSGNYTTLSPSTMMVMDIEALQHLYGANMAFNSSDDVYNFGRNEELLETIWDGGGSDTLDCSNQILGCEINLAGGQYSSIGIRRTDAEIKLGLDLPSSFFLDAYDRANLYNGVDNLGIAKGAIIENAYGGSASDTMFGNGVANHLVGGGGADKVWGEAGNDWLEGQAGNDILVGGAGLDRMDGGAGSDVFDYNRLTETRSSVRAADVISGFTSGTDRIDLSTLDAKTAAAGDQAFTFIGAAAFSAAGQVRFANGVLFGSTDADASAEFVIQLSGVTTVTAGDFVL